MYRCIINIYIYIDILFNQGSITTNKQHDKNVGKIFFINNTIDFFPNHI